MARNIATLFRYRGHRRAQVTLKNGRRPARDFDKHDDAKQWISEQLALLNSEHSPELGGPGEASLAQALAHYAGLYTISKGGCDAEIDRIKRYLEGAGLTPLKILKVDDTRALVPKSDKPLPPALAAYRQRRLDKHPETLALIRALAKRRCNTLSTADVRRLMTTMEKEGLSESTIQKEIALIKHLFNVAAKEWNWKGFENPCAGLKLGKSKQRFVFLTEAQKVGLRQALAKCDNPYFWPLVEICLQTTLRVGSLLEMDRTNVDLDGRIAVVPAKGRLAHTVLSKIAVQILRDMPVHPSGRYFPMSGNAVRKAWDHVRRKIGMPTLMFKDLRHVAATDYARMGANSHQLQHFLGHTSTRMAEVYVDIVGADLLAFLDRIAPAQAVYEIPEPATGSGEDMQRRSRTRRITAALTHAVEKGLQTQPPADGAGDAPPDDAAPTVLPSETPPPHPPVTTEDMHAANPASEKNVLPEGSATCTHDENPHGPRRSTTVIQADFRRTR